MGAVRLHRVTYGHVCMHACCVCMCALPVSTRTVHACVLCIHACYVCRRVVYACMLCMHVCSVCMCVVNRESSMWTALINCLLHYVTRTHNALHGIVVPIVSRWIGGGIAGLAVERKNGNQLHSRSQALTHQNYVESSLGVVSRGDATVLLRHTTNFWFHYQLLVSHY